MSLQNHLFFFILLTLFFIQISAFVPCNITFRACPSNFTCSENGQLCQQNDDPDVKINSRWSLLTNECVNGKFCEKDEYCLDYKTDGKNCVTNKIFICDAYLAKKATSRCDDPSFLLKPFEDCENSFLQSPGFTFDLKDFAEYLVQNPCVSSRNTFPGSTFSKKSLGSRSILPYFIFVILGLKALVMVVMCLRYMCKKPYYQHCPSNQNSRV